MRVAEFWQRTPLTPAVFDGTKGLRLPAAGGAAHYIEVSEVEHLPAAVRWARRHPRRAAQIAAAGRQAMTALDGRAITDYIAAMVRRRRT